MELDEAINKVCKIEINSSEEGEALDVIINELENRIPKKKIEDKIKELQEEKEQLRLEHNVTWDSGIYKLDLKMNALKELLEDK